MFVFLYGVRVIIKADAPYIKMVSEQFDRCHGTLLQYVDFLSSAISPVMAYAQFIPSLNELVHKYHLEPEVTIFFVVAFYGFRALLLSQLLNLKLDSWTYHYFPPECHMN